jgi:hypothetical protein
LVGSIISLPEVRQNTMEEGRGIAELLTSGWLGSRERVEKKR